MLLPLVLLPELVEFVVAEVPVLVVGLVPVLVSAPTVLSVAAEVVPVPPASLSLPLPLLWP
ncbi:MAG TPA: hypothetical protein ENK31_10405 [Nannocystis exedens]|nr:hypothetical protein [Nannocystis exedens]